METPTTLEDLEEQIRQIIPNADFEIDEDTGHVMILTNLVADEDGDLVDAVEDFNDRETLFDDETDQLEAHDDED